MSLNNEPCMTRLTLTDLKPVKFHYFPFMNSLDKCDGRFNNDFGDGSSTKVYAPSKTTKGVNVKVFNMITTQQKMLHAI